MLLFVGKEEKHSKIILSKKDKKILKLICHRERHICAMYMPI